MELINYPYLLTAGLYTDVVNDDDLILIGKKDQSVDGNYKTFLTNRSTIIGPQVKTYAARIRQTGTAAPTELAVQKNNIGPATWKRSGVGLYQLQIMGGFPDQDAVFIHQVMGNPGDTICFYKARWLNANTIELSTYKSSGTLEDAHMTAGAYFKVEVYP